MLILAACAALASPELDHTWYLWRTERTDEAFALAQESLAETPDDLAWLHLALVAGVDAGDGPRLEHRYREALADDPESPIWRAALAMVLALRNTESGPWCGELGRTMELVSPTQEPAATWFGLQAKRIALRVCEGSADKLGIDIRRTAADTELAFGDAVIDRVEAGYAKLDLPPDLEKALDAEPLLLRDLEPLWLQTISGPAVSASRTVVRKKLVAASTSDRPAEAWAAIRGWESAGNLRKAEAAAQHLLTLDPEVDPLKDRESTEVQDPAVYAEIAAAVAAGDQDALAALDPTLPAAVAAVADARAGLMPEGPERVALRRDAWRATPDDRLMALRFVREAAASGTEAEAALEAMAVLLADRSVDPRAKKPGRLDERRTPRFLMLLDLRAQLELAAGQPEAAVATRQEALLFGAGPAELAQLGMALAAAEDTAAATLVLGDALGTGLEDADLSGRARAALESVFTPERHARGLGGFLVDAARESGDEARAFPWEGEDFPLPELAGPLEATEEEEAPPELLRLLTWTPSWDPQLVPHLEHVAAVASTHGDSILVASYAADPREAGWTRWLGETELPVPTTWQGPGALATLGAAELPLTVLVDPSGAVLAAVVGHDGDEDTRLDEAVSAFFGDEE